MSDITKHLGKTSSYKATYDPLLLVREPRQRNRTYLGIQNSDLPFVGYDIWNAFEVSTLLSNGCPVSLIAKVTYSCDSEYIVESKSIKLYFNSFNMEKRDYIGSVEDRLEQMKIGMLYSACNNCNIMVALDAGKPIRKQNNYSESAGQLCEGCYNNQK